MTRQFSLFDRGNGHAIVASALMILAIILGGGGSPHPFMELLLSVSAALLAVAWLWLKGPLRLPTARNLWLLSALVAIVPLVQLIPLPPSIWTALPAREWQVAALNLVGSASSWQPISTSPSLTLASLLSLGPPLLLLWMTGTLQSRERRWLLAAIGGLALISALLGAMQLAGGETAPRLYSSTLPRIVTGFQANRNATADVLLIGLVALAAFAANYQADRRRAGEFARGDILWLCGAGLILVLACILTASRAGVALVVPVIIASWAIMSLGKHTWHWPRILTASAATIAAFGGLFLLLRQNAGLQMIAARFDVTGDGRQHLWTDTLFAIGQHWPTGSGIGTFVPTFISLEPLEVVDHSTPNRAHNDYLELALEAGPLGITILAAAAIVVIMMAFRGWQRRPQDRVQIIFGAAALVIIALHSIVDYPFRSMSLACLGAVAAGMLVTPPKPKPVGKTSPNDTAPRDDTRREPSRTRRSLVLPAALSAVLIAFAASSAAVGLDRMSGLNPTLERLVPSPFRNQAHRSAAALALANGQNALALQHATTAVRSDPGNAQSLALMGSAQTLSGDTIAADATFRVAAQRGWRNWLTQIYWFDTAMAAGDIKLAMLRTDALLRTDPNFIAGPQLLEAMEITEEGRTELAKRLAERPVWIRTYFTTDDEMPSSTLLTKSDVAIRSAKIQPMDCDTILDLTRRILSRGMRREAMNLWTSSCDAKFETGLSDGSFEELADTALVAPFGWQRHVSGDVEINLTRTENGKGRQVLAHNSSPSSKLLLSQAIAIDPGAYLVKAKITQDGVPAIGSISISLDCDGRRRLPGNVQGDVAGTGQKLVIGECPRPVLGIWLKPNTTISLDDVVITSVDQ